MRGFPFTKWNTRQAMPRLRPLLAVLLPLVVSGCVSLLQPVGDWARPSDLTLNEKSLAGVTVAVRTGRLGRDNEVTERQLKVRAGLESALKAIGASIVDAKGELEPDVTLWYLDRGVMDSQTSYVSEIAFLMTGGIVPWVSSREVGGELRVTDNRGALLGEQSIKLVDVQAFGWLALVHVFNFSDSSRERRRDMSRSFMRSAQNLVYSQSLRTRLAKGVGVKP